MSKVMFVDPTRHALGIALCEAAGISADHVRRLVLDLKVGGVPILYVEMFADSEVLDVNLGDLGITVKGADEE